MFKFNGKLDIRVDIIYDIYEIDDNLFIYSFNKGMGLYDLEKRKILWEKITDTYIILSISPDKTKILYNIRNQQNNMANQNPNNLGNNESSHILINILDGSEIGRYHIPPNDDFFLTNERIVYLHRFDNGNIDHWDTEIVGLNFNRIIISSVIIEDEIRHISIHWNDNECLFDNGTHYMLINIDTGIIINIFNTNIDNNIGYNFGGPERVNNNKSILVDQKDSECKNLYIILYDLDKKEIMEQLLITCDIKHVEIYKDELFILFEERIEVRSMDEIDKVKYSINIREYINEKYNATFLNMKFIGKNIILFDRKNSFVFTYDYVEALFGDIKNAANPL